jgi:DNA-3-methyladenine glycosylase
MNVLQESFYNRKEVTQIARQLIGKKLVTNLQGKTAAGIIVETEAYSFRERGCLKRGV